ncbi:MAG: hypothetical protein MPEBLZ_03659 [Candidatus Methanoperedens nitroreducens]|uniref:Uncharacterized protein n=1 Tax=Candidatus Methanoperedens nitratireducens TaxID=1392998 RepID=A0A0N8KQC9_9EURY|nr:hypothetical protein [Candidatus Methanoperedens sp. BLZ2]KPQ41786.1 MAG: hypothetical protein MPEBLZ_03659 [Candidatus Methanoperedens sp. BLZ1]CAG0984820.1 hypothetical protein METP2_02203 [Methanosarcinales archaeon]SNQ59967.1 hypothetical protein MNV_1490006 [Candidatus Methanoperedens nitroreducens]
MGTGKNFVKFETWEESNQKQPQHLALVGTGIRMKGRGEEAAGMGEVGITRST